MIGNLKPAWVIRKINLKPNIMSERGSIPPDDGNIIILIIRSLLTHYISNKGILVFEKFFFKRPKHQIPLLPSFPEKCAIVIIVEKDDGKITSIGTNFFPQMALIDAIENVCKQFVYDMNDDGCVSKNKLNSIKIGILIYTNLERISGPIRHQNDRVIGNTGLVVRGDKLLIGSSGTVLKMVEEVGNIMPDLNMIFKTALAKTCINAGLPQDSWASKDKTD